MLHQLHESETRRVLPLLAGAEHALIVNAVAENIAPGRIFVDDRDAPRTLFASTPEGHHLIGAPNNPTFNSALADLIFQQIIPAGKAHNWAFFFLHYYPADWEAKLDAIFDGREPVKQHQRYFKLDALQVDWRQALPAGYELRPVDQALLARISLKNLDHVKGWAVGNFGSLENFLRRGFGFCLLHKDTIASWCMADCVSGQRCEVGIHTDADYRQRGLATLTVAATVDYCLQHNLTEIGWHCWSQNRASAATALRVGFQEKLQHHAFFLWLNPIDGLLVQGNLALMAGRYAEAADYYDRALAKREHEHRVPFLLRDRAAEQLYYYNAARARALAGDRAAAERHLNQAIERGSFRQGAY